MDEKPVGTPQMDPEDPRDATPATPEIAAEPDANGNLPRLTVEAILESPSDLREEIVNVPEWGGGGSVKIRTLTSGERSRIRQVGMRTADSDLAWGEMEIQQFLSAVIEPTFTEHQVRKLYAKSGPAFQRVIDAHDKLSAMKKEELAEARQTFPEQE